MATTRAWSRGRQPAAANLGTVLLACIVCACESRQVPIGADPGGASAEGGRDPGSSSPQGGAAGDSPDHTGGRAARAVAGAAGSVTTDKPTGGGGNGTHEGGAGTGGSKATDKSTGGGGNGLHEGGAATGGSKTTTGGREDAGSQGGAAGAVNAPLPYPSEPTLPLDPDCTCPSDDEVCNAAGQCVPRCDGEQRCAAWLVNGPVQSMHAEGSTLYFTTPPETDPLGNPVSLGTLWRVEDSDPRPERVSNAIGLADDRPDEVAIVGRNAGATYVTATSSDQQTLYELTDAGEVRLLVDAELVRDSVVLPSGVFYWNEAGLWRMRYDAEAVPELMVQREEETGRFDQALAGDELIWYTSGDLGEDPSQTYVFNPDASPAEAAGSAIADSIPDDLIGVVGDIGLTGMDCSVTSYDPTGNRLLRLLDLPPFCYFAIYAGWLYALCHSDTEEVEFSLVRSPTTVGRLPQEILPAEFLTPYSDRFATEFAWTVSPENVYWAQWRSEPTLQYIFRAPLPPQPCDEDLPCQNTGERCGDDGLCGR